MWEIEALSGVLRKNCCALVTLHKERRLRGCVGYIEAPLYQTVRECDLAAALHDPRFKPVSPDQLPALRLEISALSPLREIAPHQIERGLHGLMISLGPQRALLLPQLAVEWKWDGCASWKKSA